MRSDAAETTFGLHWLSAPEWLRLLDAAELDVEALYGWFDLRPHGERRRHDLRARVSARVAAVIWVLVILGLIVVVALLLVALYNRLVRLRNRVDNAWAQVEVQLKRRWDLIPNLVETVKGYAAHERETFEAVTQARARAQQAGTPAEAAQAEGILGAALGRLFAVAEAYPELQADENFRQLQTELAETENKVAVSRQVYNDTVLTYHNAIQTFPGHALRGAVRLHDARVLRGRGRSTTGGAVRRLLAVAARRRARWPRAFPARHAPTASRCSLRTSPSTSSRTARSA